MIELKRGDKYSIEGRYFNAQGWAVAIVASVTHELDWGAYIGSTTGPLTDKETLDYVVKWGCKLREEDARYFFPRLKDMPYRP
jgi:hypothetical protein